MKLPHFPNHYPWIGYVQQKQIYGVCFYKSPIRTHLSSVRGFAQFGQNTHYNIDYILSYTLYSCGVLHVKEGQECKVYRTLFDYLKNLAI